MIDQSQNVIHQLFSELGVNLDYVPQSKAEGFLMALQFAAAIWFIHWFVKFLFGFMKDFFRGRF